MARLGGLRDRIEADVKAFAPEAVIFGAGAPRLPNTAGFRGAGRLGGDLLMALDVEGVAVSSGSACSSGKVKRSHVLGGDGRARRVVAGAIRVSWAGIASEEDVERFSTFC